MIYSNLQLFLNEKDSDSVRWVRKGDVLCLRLTASSLEILTVAPTSQKTKVFVITGSGTLELWTDLVLGRVSTLKPRELGIERIRECYEFSLVKDQIHGDPNPVSSDSLLVETHFTRDLWQLRHLEVLALKPGRAILLQFRERYAYSMEPLIGTYQAVRDDILASNLVPGCKNHFSAVGMKLRPFADARRTYDFTEITAAHKNMADEGGWQIVMNRRTKQQDLSQGQSMAI